MSYARGKDNITALPTSVAAPVRNARRHNFEIGFSDDDPSWVAEPRSWSLALLQRARFARPAKSSSADRISRAS